MAGTSPWRANDVVEYDAMRESATRLASMLLSTESPQFNGAVEIQSLRRDVLCVDGHDRAAVLELATRIRRRIAELSEPKQ